MKDTKASLDCLFAHGQISLKSYMRRLGHLGRKEAIPMTAKLIVSQDYVCSDCMDSLDQRECDDCGELFNFEDVDHEIGCLNNGERHICSSCLEERRE